MQGGKKSFKFGENLPKMQPIIYMGDFGGQNERKPKIKNNLKAAKKGRKCNKFVQFAQIYFFLIKG